MTVVREDINNDVLIREMEIRPALYDKQLKEYNDLPLKKCLWEEITAKLFPITWTQMTVDQKDKAVRDTQKRWKNLRACFTRELRLQKTGRDTNRRKYVYYSKLSFLTPSIELQEITKTDDFEQEEYREEEDYEIKEDTITIPLNLPSSNVAKKRKVDSFIDFVDNVSKHEDSYYDHMNTYSNSYKSNNCISNNCNSNTVKSNNCNSNVNIDSDTNFALSLVPMLRVIPLHKKIDAQISILQILKQHMCQEKRNFNCNVTIKEENFLSDNEKSDP